MVTTEARFDCLHSTVGAIGTQMDSLLLQQEEHQGS